MKISRIAYYNDGVNILNHKWADRMACPLWYLLLNCCR